MRERALPAADVITPNQFELELLAGRETKTMADALAAVAALHARGPGAILVTSLHTNETPAASIDMIASDGTHQFLVRTPKLPITVNGAGDAIAALFFAHYLQSQSVAQALSRAASSVFGILERTAEKGSREILLIEAQEEIVSPARVFEPSPL
jgi:pyridoxine kinase